MTNNNTVATATTAAASTYLPWPEYKAKLIAEGKWTPKMVDDGNGNMVEKTYDREYLPRGRYFAQRRAEGKLPERKTEAKAEGAKRTYTEQQIRIIRAKKAAAARKVAMAA